MKALNKVIIFSQSKLTDISTQLPAVAVLGDPQFEICPGAGFTLGNAPAAPEHAWLAHLISHQIPTLSLAQSEHFLPHYVGMIELGAVSFTKGCYLGQEIIARMHYKANLKKHLVSIIGDEVPNGERVNEVIFEGKRYTLIILEH
jgi:folate-binding protein YgfZ